MSRSIARISLKHLVLCVCLLALAGGPLLLACSKLEPGKCNKNEDCTADAAKKICDKNDSTCVGCLNDTQCADKQTCDIVTKTCKATCNEDKDCDQSKGKQACKRGACVPKCDDNNDCKPKVERCQDNQCVDNTCEDDSKCPDGNKCDTDNKYCIDNRLPKGSECPGPKGEKCQEGLQCLTYKGGTVNYCWKPCSKKCDEDEICVTADKFADGHDVCMKKVNDESATYNYDEGTACSDTLIPLHGQGAPQFGSCWKTCTENCLGDRKCLNHPHVDDEKVKFCFKACKADTDCPKGSKCQENAKANNEFYCY